MLQELGVAGAVTSMVVNDIADFVKKVYKDSDIPDKVKHKNRQTAVYRVVEDALNAFTNGRHRDGDVLRDTAENMVNGFMDERISNMEIVRQALGMSGRRAADDDCDKFVGILYHEICKQRNEDLWKEESFRLQV